MNKKSNLASEFMRFVRYRFNLDEDKESEAVIIESIRRNVEFKGINLWTLIFAILIASIGLNINSTAVIIGAMLISPLMGPIMGLGMGAAIFDFELIKHSLKNLSVAVGIGLLTSTLYFLITPLHEAHSELLARTTPTIWDVLIALCGGLTGIIASSRKNISNAVAGVAIATALMPPLCTAGYGIGTGNWSFFAGAFYLFLINSVFISISTFLIVRLFKFHPVEFVDKSTEIKIKRIISIIAVLMILPSIYLAYRFVEQEFFKRNAQAFIAEEVTAENLVVLSKNIDPVHKDIHLIVFGEQPDDSLVSRILKKKYKYKLEDANITIRNTSISSAAKQDITELKSGFLEELYNKQEEKLGAKENEIDSLSIVNEKLKHQVVSDTLLMKEFNSLFGETKELSVFKTPVLKNTGEADTVLFVYITFAKKHKQINKTPVENWMKVRTQINNVKVIINSKVD